MTWRACVGSLALLVIALTPVGAGAQPGAGSSKDWLRTDTRRQATSGASNRGGIGRVLVVVVLSGIGGALIWRKSRKSRLKVIPTKTHVRVVGGTLVGPKARAVVAEVGGRLILLGVTEQSVRKLAWLDNLAEVDTDGERDAEQRFPSAPAEPEQRRSTLSRPTELRRKPAPQRSKFTEVLRDAVGIKPQPLNDSALILAENTQDRVHLSGSRAYERDDASLIDIEGQAAGLVSRLHKSKQ